MQRRSERIPKKTSRKRRRARLMVLVSTLAVTVGSAFALTASYVKTLPTLDPNTLNETSQSTLVYSADQQWLGCFAADGDRRPLKSLRDAGAWLPRAFIAAEDKDFFHHHGVDFSAIARSAFQDMKSRSIVGGGSTITQQLVKLTIFPRQQRTIERKIQEILLALELERREAKPTILLQYLNALYFGKMGGVQVYGVESAALHAFGKHARDLTPAQAALLAAIPNQPTRFALRADNVHLARRQAYILSRMRNLQMLSNAAYRHAVIEQSLAHLNPERLHPAPYESMYPYVMTQVSREAPTLIANALQMTPLEAELQLQTRGLRIVTTIDSHLQRAVHAVMTQDRLFLTAKDRLREEAGVALVSTADSRVLAIGGGRDFTQNEVDHSLALRQPGSSLKPLIVYAPALDAHRLTPGSIVDDAPRNFPDPNAQNHIWFPKNWDSKFHGLMTVRDALMQSYNGPAISILEGIHPATGYQYAEALGLHGLAREDAMSLGLAIGGIRGGVSPLELASAYAAFGHDGSYTPTHLIERIEDRDGHVIYQAHPHAIPVFSRATTHMMTNMLQSVLASPYGTAYPLHTLAGTWAGKTGTTDENRDAWFIGYNRALTVSIWMGYDLPHPIPDAPRGTLTGHPLGLFSALAHTKEMAQALRTYGRITHAEKAGSPDAAFVRAHVCTKSGALASPYCIAAKDDEWDEFPKGSEPTSVCLMHRQIAVTSYQHQWVLATTETPPAEIRWMIFLDRRVMPQDKALDKKYEPLDWKMIIPTRADPRGGTPLCEIGEAPEPSASTDPLNQASSMTVTPLPPSPSPPWR